MIQISYPEYTTKLLLATHLNPKVALNLSAPQDKEGVKYFKSKEGISYLTDDGFMGGLCRYSKGSEKVAKLHQRKRKELGGYFLECYEGALSEIYAKQGFKIVARVPFNEQFAVQGWKSDKDLVKKPDVVFMSLHKADELLFEDYDKAFEYTKNTLKELV